MSPPDPSASPPACFAITDFWRRWLDDRDYFFRMCVQWLRGNRHDAEDALSRGALNALEYLRRYPQGVEKFRPWALRILHNLCIDILSSGRRVAPPAKEAAAEPVTGVACQRHLPDRAVYVVELHAALDGAIATLPPRLHTAFRLRFLDDLAYEQISRELEITRENARKRIQQARDLLREQLEVIT